MASVYLGLGTNLGDRWDNLRQAVTALGELGRVVAWSRVFETRPMYVTDQPAFLNMAVHLDTGLPPRPLLSALKTLEDRMGRVVSRRYGPRLIDLDILLYDDARVDAPDLTIPHPRLAERRFALAPLADLAPALDHPGAGRSIAQLLACLSDDGDIAVAGPLPPA